MTTHGFALFDTEIGRCGIAWGARGIIGVQLPEASEARTRARLVRRYPHAREAPPPAEVRRVIDGIVALLGGQASDLSAAARDVGQALGRNPFPIIVPCHRVLAAGGFSANGGVTTKLRLLTIERARTSDAPTLFDGDRAFGFALKPKAQRRR